MSKERPNGCDQQGRFLREADVRIDPDEIDELGLRVPPPEPWWQDVLLVAVALLVLLLVFAPQGR